MVIQTIQPIKRMPVMNAKVKILSDETKKSPKGLERDITMKNGIDEDNAMLPINLHQFKI